MLRTVASGDSFRVAWTERRYENASLTSTERWTAILTVVFDTPHDAERLHRVWCSRPKTEWASGS
jgi:type IV secretion system protein TrbF